MPWTEEETKKFQMDNAEHLAEINKTLRPDKNLSGKIGIFCPGQAGDTGVVTGILNYRDIVFPGKEIIWYINHPNADLLRYAPISEVRPWPWAGNGLPANTPDFYPLLCDENNRLNKELAKQYELTNDLEDGWFPTPWMLPVVKRHGIEYSNCSKRVFGIDENLPWHPVFNFSEEEYENALQFTRGMLAKYIILFETFAGSSQSRLDEEMIKRSMNICREQRSGCKFIFASHKYLRDNEQFPGWLLSQKDVFFAKDFTVRQCALIAAQCDFIISVSSGISVASSALGMSIQMLQFCGSKICSTAAISGQFFNLVTADDKPFESAKDEFYTKLTNLLNQHQ